MGITLNIQKRLAQIEIELNSIIKERPDVIHGTIVARIGWQHVVILGPGGTGKSYMVEEFVRRIDGGVLYDNLMHETIDPGEVLGPTNIKTLAEKGLSRRVIKGMLPDATDAFLDEIFNANSPVLHSLHSILNERVFKDGGEKIKVPLRSLYAGTNKLTADADLAPFFDRLHLRYVVDFLRSRQNRMDMVAEALARLAGTSAAAGQTQVTADELDTAHDESLGLSVDRSVWDAFLDMHEGLRSEGVVISDRRVVDGMAAVKANAWLRGHDDVQVGDLDILAHMWWTLQEQRPAAQQLILSVANPSHKLALDLMTDLDKIKTDFEQAKDKGLDPAQMVRIAMNETVNLNRLLEEGEPALAPAIANGSDIRMLEAVIAQTRDFKEHIKTSVGL